MSVRKKEKPFMELALQLQAWRELKFRSALAFHQSGDFSFSYSAYADFERGVTLPSIDAIIEIARFHGVEARDAALLWAKTQMPTEDLKGVFAHRLEKRKPNITTPEDFRQAEAVPRSLENTWVFTHRDRELFAKMPWLIDLCLRLVSVYPDEVSPQQLGLKTKAGFKKFKATFLHHWIEAGHIIESAGGLKLARPHYYFPNTADWNELRQRFFVRVATRITERMGPQDIESGRSLRTLESRTFNSSQKERWLKRLQDLTSEFLNEPYERSEHEPHQMVTLVLALGERPMDIPIEVIRKCE